jgi:hypothetical protein
MKFVYTKDGTLNVVVAAPKAHLEKVFGPLTDEQYKAHVISRSIPEGVEFREITDNELPQDRLFRDAWKDEGGIKIDMPKARAIHMARIRDKRNKRLEELDKRKYGAEYDAERQALRDLPQTFDLTQATTPDELKALWPDGL